MSHALPTRLRARGASGWGGRALLHAHPAFACEGVSGRGSQPVCRMHTHACASKRGAGVGRPRAVPRTPHVCMRGGVAAGVAAGGCCTHTPRLRARGCRGGVAAGLSHATPTRVRARGALGWGGRALLRTHAFTSATSSLRARRSRHRGRAWSGPRARPTGLHKSDRPSGRETQSVDEEPHSGGANTCGLEGKPPWEEAVVSPGMPGA